MKCEVIQSFFDGLAADVILILDVEADSPTA